MAGLGSRSKQHIRDTYDTIASHFDATRGYMWKECAGFIDTLHSGKLVDIGCGNGRNSIYAAKRGLFVVGVDISSSLLRIVKEKAAKEKAAVHLVKCDASMLPFKASVFDSCIFIAAVHHIASEGGRVGSFSEIRRILLDGGHGLASAWAYEQERFKDERSQDVTVLWDRKYERFYHLFRSGELDDLILESGLRVEVSERSHDNYFCRFLKST